MLSKRIIPCLDVRSGRVTKGIRFKDNQDVGDPVEIAQTYAGEGADELVFYDIGATPRGLSIGLEWVRAVARVIHIPFTVGGGIRTLFDMHAVLLAGADKISINSAAVREPQLIEAGAKAFGRQCMVLGMDVKRIKKSAQREDFTIPSGYEVVIDGGRTRTGRDALDWAREAVQLGAGEICLNSIDADGTQNGYDLEMTSLISEAVSVPVIASGGAGCINDIQQLFAKTEAEGALLASLLHFKEISLTSLKAALLSSGLPIRPMV